MIPSHRSTEPDAGARGLRFGREHRDAVGLTVDTYERLFDALHGLAEADLDQIGGKVRSRLERHAPDLAAEIEAIAAGAGVPAERLMAINARTEIIGGAARPECSVVGVGRPADGRGPLLAQNWDWHPNVAGALVIWTVIEPDGTWFTTLTEAGILAKVGLNSRGLALCLNILGSSADGGDGGMPIHVLLRQVLQRCDEMEAVERMIAAQSYSASSALSVIARDAGKSTMRSFEVSPSGVETLTDRDGILLHTNHFLDLPLGLVDRYRSDWPDTVARLEELERRFAGGGEPLGDREVRAALSSHEAEPTSICCHDANNASFAHRQQSLASILMRPEEGRLKISDGPPCTTPFREVRPPQPGAGPPFP